MNLIDFFDKCRFWGVNRNKFLSKIYFYPIVNNLVNIVANCILPLYFIMTKNSKKYSLKYNKTSREEKVIVSLTSFPVRLPRLWLVVECLLRQSVKPDRIVLYLTASQVEDVGKLPKRLLEQRERGLEIVLCPDNIRSHTKYYYAMKDNPNDVIVTVDDDLFYRTDLVESLLKNHYDNPNAIIANWVKRVLPTTDKYREWPEERVPQLGYDFLLFGVTGMLYPPKCMYEDVFLVELIQNLTLTADDVWLTAMALMKGTPIYYTGYEYNHLPVLIWNNQTLLSVNRERNQVCVDNINNYYQEKLGIRPFIDLVKK